MSTLVGNSIPTCLIAILSQEEKNPPQLLYTYHEFLYSNLISLLMPESFLFLINITVGSLVTSCNYGYIYFAKTVRLVYLLYTYDEYFHLISLFMPEVSLINNHLTNVLSAARFCPVVSTNSMYPFYNRGQKK